MTARHGAHTFNPSTAEADVGDSVWSAWPVRLHSEFQASQRAIMRYYLKILYKK